ncbi:regulator of chromosome condensation family protein [Striga asiatica]|uniref:Regulator of chromosome condensation family protein n=1 Tax=Striga asiatica TaxID=4170 RepID=A0A5A7NYK2_STRAF|nr:regulator of chromosome condensation family protein [Striga asiatica]
MVNTPNPTHTGDASRRIISIAVGEAHTLALTGLLSLTFRFYLSFYIANKSAIVGDGKVYSWGGGMFGRLGSGSEENRHFPVRVSFYGTLKIIGIAAGAYHSLLLQLNMMIPRAANHSRFPMCVEAGGMMSLTIDELGSLWIWGSCPNPSQAHEPPEITFLLISTGSPLPLSNFHGHSVVKVACGNEHVIALVTAGKDPICYSWGCNTHGQLGLGDKESRPSPKIIEKFNSDSPWEAYDMACGAAHTALLAKRKSPNELPESFCWTFGPGYNGKLGHWTTQGSDSPEMVKGLPLGIFGICGCSLFHTNIVSSGGEVWSWGMEKGLGLCPDANFAGNALLPLLFPPDFVNSRGSRVVGPTWATESDIQDQDICQFFEQSNAIESTVKCLIAEQSLGAKLFPCCLHCRQDTENREAIILLSVTADLMVTDTIQKRKDKISTFHSTCLVLSFLCTTLSPPDFQYPGGGVGNMETILPRVTVQQYAISRCSLWHSIAPDAVMDLYDAFGHRRAMDYSDTVVGRTDDSYSPMPVLWPPIGNDDDIGNGNNREKGLEGGVEIYRADEIPIESGVFDIAKEWERMVDSLDERGLVCLEMFYRDMHAGVKYGLLKRRVLEMVKECLRLNASNE